MIIKYALQSMTCRGVWRNRRVKTRFALEMPPEIAVRIGQFVNIINMLLWCVTHIAEFARFCATTCPKSLIFLAPSGCAKCATTLVKVLILHDNFCAASSTIYYYVIYNWGAPLGVGAPRFPTRSRDGATVVLPGKSLRELVALWPDLAASILGEAGTEKGGAG